MIVVLLAAAVVVVLAQRRRYVVARVWGHSMSPTFRDGERVIATRRRRYHVGDNSGHSEDSRHLGYIDLARVAGAVRPTP
jgi:signal peptidase I